MRPKLGASELASTDCPSDAQVIIFFGIVAGLIYKCGPKRRPISKKKKKTG